MTRKSKMNLTYESYSAKFRLSPVEYWKKTTSRSRTNIQGSSIQEDKVRYRESNSSRLRRESKYTPVTSDSVNSSCRSKSCSSPCRSPISRFSNSTSGSGAQSPERSRSNNSNRSVSASQKSNEKNTLVAKSRNNSRSRNKNSPKNLSPKVTEPRVEVKSGRNSQRSTNNTPANADPPNGYGKALVTPTNKRLLINRSIRPVSSPAPSKIPLSQLNRSRSPVLSWKAENRPSSTSSTPQRNLSKVNILSNKTCRDKRPTRETRNPPLMAFNTAVRVRPGPPSPEHKSGSVSARSTPANKKPQHFTIPETKNVKTSRNKQKIQDDIKSNASSHKYFNSNQNSEVFGHIKIPSIIKTNCEVTNQKNEISAQIKTPFIVKPSFVNYGSKNFKPQLEDIKSSHFVLNIKKQDHSVKRNIQLPKPSIQKPQPLIEEQRRIALLHAKNKFRTKKFWDDARYEKIEGLNWVSWK